MGGKTDPFLVFLAVTWKGVEWVMTLGKAPIDLVEFYTRVRFPIMSTFSFSLATTQLQAECYSVSVFA